jgi:hypothetical protein
MRKMTTFFKKDPSDLSKVINEIDPVNAWVLLSSTIATRKYDGTACAIINGKLYKRYDAKKGKPIPEGAIPCQDPDPITGHHPHWIRCSRENKADKYFWEAWDKPDWFFFVDGTYELCGEKIQGNPEKINGHKLIPHGAYALDLVDKSFDGIKTFLESRDIEGIVFHGDNGQMCKIRKKDFGMNR